METVIRLLAGMSVEQLVIALLILAVSYLFRLVTKLQYQFNQLDKLMMAISIVLHIKTGVKLTQNHRSGDYDIVNPMLDNVQKTAKEKDTLIESYRRMVAKHDAEETEKE